MCGRYTLRKQPTAVATPGRRYAVRRSPAAPDSSTPRYNIAPTQCNLVLKRSEQPETLDADYARWGLIPSWAKSAQGSAPMINARSETLATKPSFRAAFQRRRCLVPADGFYEWKKGRSAALPFFFCMTDDAVFYMAGIWETWYGDTGESIESYTILTTHANSLMARYHDRMPVILLDEAIATWLEADPSELTPAQLHDLFAPIDPERMSCQAANPIVNNNHSEGPACLEAPASIATSQLDLGF